MIAWEEQASTLVSRTPSKLSNRWKKEARSSSCSTLMAKIADAALISFRPFWRIKKRVEISNLPSIDWDSLGITMLHSWMTLQNQDQTKAISYMSTLISKILSRSLLRLSKTLLEWPCRWLWVNNFKLQGKWRLPKRFSITKILM